MRTDVTKVLKGKRLAEPSHSFWISFLLFDWRRDRGEGNTGGEEKGSVSLAVEA